MARIFIVEENPVIAGQLVDVVADEGHRVLHLDPAECSVDTVLDAAPDLIILDVRVDQRHPGWHLVQDLCHDPHTASIPMIVCSTEEQQLRQKLPVLREHGIPVIGKPFDVCDLLWMVSVMLEGIGGAGRITPLRMMPPTQLSRYAPAPPDSTDVWDGSPCPHAS